jgi:hypothetical protein
MIDNKPVCLENIKSYMCYACLNYYPAQAVKIKSKTYMKSYTEENEKYPHPYTKAKDISGQKKNKIEFHL